MYRAVNTASCIFRRWPVGWSELNRFHPHLIQPNVNAEAVTQMGLDATLLQQTVTAPFVDRVRFEDVLHPGVQTA